MGATPSPYHCKYDYKLYCAANETLVSSWIYSSFWNLLYWWAVFSNTCKRTDLGLILYLGRKASHSSYKLIQADTSTKSSRWIRGDMCLWLISPENQYWEFHDIQASKGRKIASSMHFLGEQRFIPHRPLYIAMHFMHNNWFWKSFPKISAYAPENHSDPSKTDRLTVVPATVNWDMPLVDPFSIVLCHHIFVSKLLRLSLAFVSFFFVIPLSLSMHACLHVYMCVTGSHIYSTAISEFSG